MGTTTLLPARHDGPSVHAVQVTGYRGDGDLASDRGDEDQRSDVLVLATLAALAVHDTLATYVVVPDDEFQP